MPPLPSDEAADGTGVAGVADAVDTVDVVCLGESMVTFLPSRAGRLADVPSFARGIGGAESNVACGLARAGHSARWISRVGADGFGEHLVREIAATGVDTRYVQRDPHRPTGIYFRTAGERAVGSEPAGPEGAAGPDGSDGPDASDRRDASDGSDGPDGAAEPLAEVLYYRAGSAAAAMSPALVPREWAWSGRVLHLTGITPALSADCRALMRELTTRAPGRPLVSFDLNYRFSLWRNADAGRSGNGEGDGRADDGRADADTGAEPGPAVLLGLARGCDLVFVGEDEAEAVWGVRGPEAIRAALPEPELLVVKQGSAGATAYARRPDGTDAVTFEPALRVDVVAPVGAGDAFAAGFLSGTLRGLPIAERLRHGHLMAAAALTVPGDLGTPPSRERADHLVALDAAEWGTLRFGPGWTDLPSPAEKWAETAAVEVPDP
ncbi:2-dehydro-3-deoxygluconokinase [Streptomyces demainii]|uniref:2-dehydro-3-deoxygluconokinase n=2 Tax=Streptomyces TaxID=1883 RepID=A0ABT9KXH6_9ACTN|nr:sugar kinase [Streptomyces demainii]MDP9613140.1 2-dehydro-3-deoxygluconokinase [Streptomyces demainii]